MEGGVVSRINDEYMRATEQDTDADPTPALDDTAGALGG